MGMDVRHSAMANQTFTRASCVGCGLCAHACPGALRQQLDQPLGRDYYIDS
jgi:formate hydrogenlyase subunit 6/NADH:ubiquinone oxidoreductase subunit I